MLQIFQNLILSIVFAITAIMVIMIGMMFFVLARQKKILALLKSDRRPQIGRTEGTRRNRGRKLQTRPQLTETGMVKSNLDGRKFQKHNVAEMSIKNQTGGSAPCVPRKVTSTAYPQKGYDRQVKVFPKQLSDSERELLSAMGKR